MFSNCPIWAEKLISSVQLLHLDEVFKENFMKILFEIFVSEILNELFIMRELVTGCFSESTLLQTCL